MTTSSPSGSVAGFTVGALLVDASGNRLTSLDIADSSAKGVILVGASRNIVTATGCTTTRTRRSGSSTTPTPTCCSTMS